MAKNLKIFRIYAIAQAENLEQAMDDFNENQAEYSFNVEEIERVQ